MEAYAALLAPLSETGEAINRFILESFGSKFGEEFALPEEIQRLICAIFAIADARTQNSISRHFSSSNSRFFPSVVWKAF